MSFYRTFIAAVAAMGLATVAFAADVNNDAAKQQQPTANTEQAAPTTADAQQANAPAADKVDLNKASTKELAKVKGLNANKAKAIVAYRKKHGDFKSVDDLKEVKG